MGMDRAGKPTDSERIRFFPPPPLFFCFVFFLNVSYIYIYISYQYIYIHIFRGDQRAPTEMGTFC